MARKPSFNYDPARKRRTFLWSIFLILGLGIGFLGFYFLFPRALNHQELKSISYFPFQGKPALLCLYEETSYSEESSTDLEGYELRLVHPDGKEIGKTFVKRPAEEPTATPPSVCMVPNGEVWIISPMEIFQSDSTWIRVLQVQSDGKFSEKPIPAPLAGNQITARPFRNSITYTDKFNEVHHFDMETGEVDKKAPDPWNRDVYFFTVAHQSGSTRQRLWYFDHKPDLDAPIFVSGIEYGLDLAQQFHTQLLVNTGSSFDEKMVVFNQAHLDPARAKLNQVSEEDYLISPFILYQDSLRAVIRMTDDASKKQTFVCYSREGKKLWTLTRADYTIRPGFYGTLETEWTAEEFRYILSPYYGIGIHTGSGAVNWEFFP